jgi:cephalosporin hydroxylase
VPVSIQLRRVELALAELDRRVETVRVLCRDRSADTVEAAMVLRTRGRREMRGDLVAQADLLAGQADALMACSDAVEGAAQAVGEMREVLRLVSAGEG